MMNNLLFFTGIFCEAGQHFTFAASPECTGKYFIINFVFFHTKVTYYTMSGRSIFSLDCPIGCLSCDYVSITGTSGDVFCPEDSCQQGYTWRNNIHGGECLSMFAGNLYHMAVR